MSLIDDELHFVPMKVLLQIGLMSLCSTTVYSQENTVVSGGECSGSGGSVSYSIGQIDHTVRFNDEFVLTEGVQQPYARTRVFVQEVPYLSDIAVFPNPSSGRFSLDVGKHEGLAFMLHDGSGKLLKLGQIDKVRTTFEVEYLPQGVYSLSIIKGGVGAAVFNLQILR